jgi:hypothetical protein
VRFTPADRALLAALPHRLPRQTLRRLRLLVRPDTILRWHRSLLARRHATASQPKRPGRPRTIRSIRVPPGPALGEREPELGLSPDPRRAPRPGH